MSLFRRTGDEQPRAHGAYQLWITSFGADKTAVARIIAREWGTTPDAAFMALFDSTPWLYQSFDAGSDTFSLLNILAAPLENAGARTEIITAAELDTPYPGS